MRRAQRVMDRGACAEGLEAEGYELPLAVRVLGEHAWARHRSAFGVEWYADDGLELGHAALDGVGDLVFAPVMHSWNTKRGLIALFPSQARAAAPAAVVTRCCSTAMVAVVR